MGTDSKIEWTDHTFNPWIGCTHVHAGCAHCYAEALAKRTGGAVWGPNGTRVLTSPANWKKPLAWNKAAQKEGVRKRVFCASLADVFEDWDYWTGFVWNHKGQVILQCDNCKHPDGAYHRDTVPPFDHTKKHYEHGCGKHMRPLTLADVRHDLFALIDATPWLDWQLLTKRPGNVQRMWPSADMFDRESEHKAYWPNVWLGTSVSNQETADQLVPELLKCRDLAPVLFLSAEPLLGGIRLDEWISDPMLADSPDQRIGELKPDIDWVIVGGESGPKARACDWTWILSLVRQCRQAEVPVFVKQLGAKAIRNGNHPECNETFPADFANQPQAVREEIAEKFGEYIKHIYFWPTKEKKGGDPEEWPKELRVRNFPAVEVPR